MKILVVYSSKTGFSEYYAKVISKKCECDILNLGDIEASTLNNYDVFVYLGGIYAGIVNGFSKFKKMYDESKNKKLVLIAVGAVPNNSYATIEKMWRRNFKESELKTIKHFYLQGGIAYEKLGFISKRLMKMAANNMYRKDKEHDLRESFNYTSESKCEPIINYLRGSK